MADEASVDGTSSSQCIGESSESTVEINIKTLDSQIYTFRVNKNLPVSALKEKIVGATGLPVEQQRLIFRGKVLKDDHLLSAYYLEDGHTLHLVARQPVQAEPSTGTNSANAAQNNGNQGNDSNGVPRSRVGQISHSVVLGSVNIGDTGEGIAADISRLVGSVLSSLASGNLNLASTGASSSSSTNSSQSPPAAETETMRNANGRNQPGNQTQPGFTVLNHHPLQSFQPSNIPRFTAIPDSLTTLSEFVNRMERALQYGGSQSPANIRDPQQSEVLSSNLRGLPTPDALRAVIVQTQQLLAGNASTALSHIAGRLEREGASTDPVIRGQIQSEAMHAGVAMQHLGAMFLELGRTIMTLRMGQSPAEALVNAGPAVYISPMGPNPIMVQPSPLQTASLFGPPPSILSGISGPFGAGDPSRNVNIHIHAGTPVAPGASLIGTGASLVGTGASSGETIHGERSNVEHSGDSVPIQGLSSRTVFAAIPARSAPEASGHVFNVLYPVQVRSQQSVPIHSSSIQVSGTQPSAVNPAPHPSSASDGTPTLVAQINMHIASALSGNIDGQSSSNPITRHAESLGSHPSMSNEVLSENDQGQGSCRSVQCTNTPGTSEGPQAAPPPGTSEGPQAAPPASTPSVGGKNDVNHQSKNVAGTEFSNNSGTVASDTTESLEQNSDSVSTTQTGSSMDGENDRPAPLGLGLGGLRPKRRGKPSTIQNQQSIARGQEVLRSLVSQTSDTNRGSTEVSSTLLPRGGQGSIGQIDSGMISNALQSPALKSLLSGVAEQAGLGSSSTFTNMLEQCTQSPGVMNTLNQIVQQVGQGEDFGGMLSGMGRGNGGIDFSRMIQQMMPVVSQALGGGPTRLGPAPGVQSEPHQTITRGNDTLDNGSSQIDVQDAVERIEQHDSPGNVFRAMLESAGHLLGEVNNYGDLVEELGNDAELTDEFMEMLQRRLNQRLQRDTAPEEQS